MNMSLYTAMCILDQLDIVSQYTETVDAVTALTISWVDAATVSVRLLRDTYGRSDAEHQVFIDVPVGSDHLITLRKTYEKAKDWLERTKANEQDRPEAASVSASV